TVGGKRDLAEPADRDRQPPDSRGYGECPYVRPQPGALASVPGYDAAASRDLRRDPALGRGVGPALRPAGRQTDRPRWQSEVFGRSAAGGPVGARRPATVRG